jgi:death on curing protein
MRPLTLPEVEYVAFRLAQTKLAFAEPIPDFATRFPGVLERCLASPFQSYGKKPLYQGLVGKAAILFYLLIKNHPFQNGNKRIAMTALLVFLYKNKKWLKVGNQELYNFAVWVAASPAVLKGEVTAGVAAFLRKHLISLKK